MTDLTGSLRSLLRDLTAVPGISGLEDAAAARFADLLRPYAASVQTDALGSVIARFDGHSGRRVAVLAHLDTVGLMVKHSRRDGSLGVVPVGGANLKALSGAAVRVGDLPGVIGVRSQHQAQPGDAVTSADDLYVDVGGAPVEITTPITYAPQFVELAGGLVASPYLDDRAGCAVLVELARRLASGSFHTVYLIGTVQEETTCAGAYHALQAVAPEAALFVDGTLSYDTPDTQARGGVALGAGPVLTAFLYVSGLNGWHAHPGLRAHLRQIAAGADLSIQQDAVHGLMSDARAVTWLGLPSALVGLPMRGKHAPLEIVHLDDLAGAVNLLDTALRLPLPALTRG